MVDATLTSSVSNVFTCEFSADFKVLSSFKVKMLSWMWDPVLFLGSFLPVLAFVVLCLSLGIGRGAVRPALCFSGIAAGPGVIYIIFCLFFLYVLPQVG